MAHRSSCAGIILNEELTQGEDRVGVLVLDGEGDHHLLNIRWLYAHRYSNLGRKYILYVQEDLTYFI